mmetsp:Transcript_20201/g.33696  ORF Transcript_20201/g.33696 Transcript_20201/m.33696 type:complete len:91 (-) Transcript_20201:508-780(-)
MATPVAQLPLLAALARKREERSQEKKRKGRLERHQEHRDERGPEEAKIKTESKERGSPRSIFFTACGTTCGQRFKSRSQGGFDACEGSPF